MKITLRLANKTSDIFDRFDRFLRPVSLIQVELA